MQTVKYTYRVNIEGIFIEINSRKLKWLLFGTHQVREVVFTLIMRGRAIDNSTQTYDRFSLVGDFNAEEKEFTLENFMDLYNLKNLMKDNTCLKSVENPSCVDLFLTNCCRSFQNTTFISTGISN